MCESSVEGLREVEGCKDASLSCLWAVTAGSCKVDELFAPVPGCLTMPKLLRRSVSYAPSAHPHPTASDEAMRAIRAILT